jgi:hypothetical protein
MTNKIETKNQWAVGILESNMESLAPEDREQYLVDVTNHGCISGSVGGVIYYHETKAIFKEHFETILEALEDYNEEIGHDAVSPNIEDYSTFYNWAVWFIVELTANEMLYQMEEE